MDVSIVVLNWNGKELLEQCIPSVIKAADVYRKTCEIIVVDNGSSDASVKYVESNFRNIRIISLDKNIGFAAGMNTGIKNATHNIVIGLNNDVVVEEDFIAPLVEHFSSDGNLFAVGAKMLLWDKKTLNFGRAIGESKFGIFRRRFQNVSESVSALYACGGAFAADRDKFLKLGGFDEDMVIYWEDLDICYRAWRRGYRTLYEPRSVVYHKFHGTNIKEYGDGWIHATSGENYLLFILKNFQDKTIFYQRILSLPILILATSLSGRRQFSVGLLRSIKKWPIFLEKRKIEKQNTIFSDREILEMSSR